MYVLRKAHGVAVVGDYAYIAGDNTIDVVRVADPSQLTVITELELSAQNLEAQGHYLYVGTWPDLVVYDVSDPGRPVETWRWNTGSDPRTSGKYIERMQVDGARLYASLNPGGAPPGGLSHLGVFDLSIPSQPRLLGLSEEIDGYITDLAALGNAVYTVLGEGGLHIYDVSRPDAPTYVGAWMRREGWGWMNEVEAASNLVYAGPCCGYGLLVLDASRPVAPVEVAYYFEGTNVYGGLEVVGTRVYENQGALTILDHTGGDPQRAPRASVMPRLDGDTEDWALVQAGALRTRLAGHASGRQPAPAYKDQALNIRAAWDPDWLYFVFEVTDEKLIAAANSATPDTVEVGVQTADVLRTFSFGLDGRAVGSSPQFKAAAAAR